MRHKMNEELSSECTLNPFDAVMLFVNCTTFSALGLFGLHAFKGWIALAIGMTVTGFILVVLGLRVRWSRPKGMLAAAWIAILLVGAIFRVAPYPWVTGGIDPGSYFDFAKVYESQGAPGWTDKLRNRFVEHGLGELYDKNNLSKKTYPFWVTENFDSVSMYVHDKARSFYYPLFLPVQSLWLAIGGKIFGFDNAGYAMFLFSFISLFGLALIVKDLAGGKPVAGLIAAALIAVNPAHAYFAKFPVSETVALGFLVSGLYFLLKFYRAALLGAGLAPKRGVLYGVLSLASFYCYYSTRISGFILIPAFYLLLVVARVLPRNNPLRKPLTFYCIGWFAVFAFAVWGQYCFSPDYTSDIYNHCFGLFLPLGAHWPRVLLPFVLVLAAIAYTVGLPSLRDARWIRAESRTSKDCSATGYRGIRVCLVPELSLRLYSALCRGRRRGRGQCRISRSAFLEIHVGGRALFFVRSDWLSAAAGSLV